MTAPDPLQFPDEEWRPVVGYEDYYEVSNLARVRRIKPGRGVEHVPRILTNRANWYGYWTVMLSINNVRHYHFVHRLVAKAFIGPQPPPQHEINHKNGDRYHAVPSNLEWVTPSQNLEDAYRRGTRVSGAKHHWSRLSDANIVEAIADIDSGMRQTAVAAKYSVSTVTVWSIKTNRENYRTSLRNRKQKN